jgi:hypothetical protein
MTPNDATTERRKEVARHEEAIRQAVREAVLTHARLGRSVVGWQDGAVVWVSPAEVLAKFGTPQEGGPAGGVTPTDAAGGQSP